MKMTSVFKLANSDNEVIVEKTKCLQCLRNEPQVDCCGNGVCNNGTCQCHGGVFLLLVMIHYCRCAVRISL